MAVQHCLEVVDAGSRLEYIARYVILCKSLGDRPNGVVPVLISTLVMEPLPNTLQEDGEGFRDVLSDRRNPSAVSPRVGLRLEIVENVPSWKHRLEDSIQKFAKLLYMTIA